ncbi:MAG TPA: YdcF family protein [Pseudolabrys sp.]
MFFILSKTVAFLLPPSNLLSAIGLIGVALLMTRFRRAGLRLAIGGFVLLAALGFSPLGNILGHVLESRFPPWDASRGSPDGIVVLGGGINSTLSADYDEPMLTGEGGRIAAVAKLARAYPNARIVYANGDASLFANGSPDAKYFLSLMDSFGVSRDRVTIEPRSRNTFENALFSKEMIKPKPGERWLLVTSAQHMPRSMGCFRRAGFPVEAYPVAWKTRTHFSAVPFNLLSEGLYQLDFATHEWIGLIAYWLTGKTSTLLPSP